jgi:hypothetical protein
LRACSGSRRNDGRLPGDEPVSLDILFVAFAAVGASRRGWIRMNITRNTWVRLKDGTVKVGFSYFTVRAGEIRYRRRLQAGPGQGSAAGDGP